MRERKPLKAEKALLSILQLDDRNAGAYNRLGILYAKEKKYKEAVECFEIAQSLDNNASSIHNVGLIYYETGKYEKAAQAFAQAIDIEGDQPGRHVAYAKALEKLGERTKAIEALETAYSLSPSTVVLRHILEIYESSNDTENAEKTRKRIEDLQTKLANESRHPRQRLARSAVRREARAQSRANRAALRKESQAARVARRTAKAAARQTTQSQRTRTVSSRKRIVVSTDGIKTQPAKPTKKLSKKRKII
jgi:tetratricopeptide (TPR) repeat protein